jgi:glycosyltransferase involved in cell wall biosynthesis
LNTGQTPLLRIAVLLPYEHDAAPSQRFRWEQWERFFPRHGVQVERVHFCTAAIARYRRDQRLGSLLLASAARYAPWLAGVVGAARAADLVVVHRNAAIAGPPVAEWLLKTLGCSLVYDFDDAIYLEPPGVGGVLRRLFSAKGRVASISRWARLVGVGNADLLGFAAAMNDAVRIWPTTIDTDSYSPCPNRAGRSPVCIGWTGSESTAQYLVNILPQVAELQKKHPFSFRVMGARIDLRAFGVDGECIPWSSTGEIEEVRRFDIGLMPLIDSPWARGKCALKALQYQALGIPAVASDVGMNREAVLHGTTGFLVPPEGDWQAPLRQLLLDPERLTVMGEAARAHVITNFSGEVWAGKIASHLRSALSAQAGSPRLEAVRR